jgi:hypothetical protein
MNNDLIPFKILPPGAVFYLDRYYGNVYRKVDHKTAEFAQHRLRNDYVGHRLSFSPSQAIRRTAIHPSELELMGVDPKAEPWMGRWEPPAGWELLGDVPAPKRKTAPRDEDLLGAFPTPESPAPQRLSKAERRAAQDLL